jgi:hypothetical protein
MSREPGEKVNRSTKGTEKPSGVRRVVLIIIGVIALLFVLRAIDKIVGGLF